MSDLDEYLDEGSKEVFTRSDNEDINSMGVTVDKDPDYSDGIPFMVDIESGEVINFNFDGTARCAALGPSGSGKTTWSKAGLPRAVDAGHNVVHISDVKNDFQSLNYEGGVSKELREKTKGLLKHEEPKSYERILAIPRFMVEHYDGDPSQYGTVFSLSLSDLTESELRFLSGYHDWRSGAAQDNMDLLLDENDLDECTLDSLIDKAGEMNNTLERKLKSLKSKQIVSNRGNNSLQDILSQLDDKKIFSLGLKHWRKYLGGDEHFFQFYSAKVLSELKGLIDDGVIERPTVVYADEFHKLAPAGENSMVKDEFQDIIDIAGRQRDMDTLFATQRTSQVPNPDNNDDLDFVGGLTEVVIFRGRNTLDEKDWKPVVKAMGVYDGGGGHQLKAWKRKINDLKRFQGIYINSERHRGPEDCPVVETLSPIPSHPG